MLSASLLAFATALTGSLPDESALPTSLSWFDAASDEAPEWIWTAAADRPRPEPAWVLPEVEPQEPRMQDPPPFYPPHSTWEGVGHHFSGKAWKESVWDGYFTQPEILLPVGLAVSAAAISHWDKTLQKHWVGLLGNHRSYSDAGQYALLAGVVFLGTVFPGEGRNTWDETWTIGESFAASSLTVFMLKTAVQRPRPGGSGIGTHSFPSGHSSSAFTSASLIEENTGPYAGIPAYGLAAFTAFERVEEGRHFPSDILAGAAIGTVSAMIFDRLHWGRPPQSGGIARPPDVKMGFVDGLHGFQLEICLGF